MEGNDHYSDGNDHGNYDNVGDDNNKITRYCKAFNLAINCI